MRGDEGIVVQVRVGGIDAVNLLALARAEAFPRVEAPDAFKQSLPPQHLVQAGDAAGEAVGRVEEGRVAVGDFNRAPQQFGGDRAAALNGAMTFAQEFHGLARPDRPVPQQPAHDAALDGAAAHVEAIRREQVEHDVVVVAGVERDVVAAGLGDGADDVERLVAVEGGDLDGDDVLDLHEPPPERERQHAAAHRGLQVEAHQRQNLRHGAAVGDQLVVAGASSSPPGSASRHGSQARGAARPRASLAASRRRCRRCEPTARAARHRRGPALRQRVAGRARTGRGSGREWRTASCARPPPRLPPRQPRNSAAARAAAARPACARR